MKHAYYMRGLGDLAGALTHEAGRQIATALEIHGFTVTVGEWTDLQRFLALALETAAGDLILLSGHSMGCKAAFDGAPHLMAAGKRVRVVGLDPLCTGPVHTPGLDATNIWGNRCGLLGPVRGATNIYLPAGPHITYPNQPEVQKAFITAATK